MKLFVRLFATLSMSLICIAASAQAWPNKPVRVVVPYPPGGATDIFARIVAEQLQSALGQAFVVENRSGAGGVIGTEQVSKAAPDGYTFLLSSSAPLAVGLKLYPKLPYDVMRDFTPVSMIADVTMVLTANARFSPSTVKELITYAKDNPGKLNIALNSLGSQSHLLTELFRVRTTTAFNMIPYKGTGPAVVDLLAGVVDADFENLPGVIEHIKSKRLKPIAVLSAQRVEQLPDVPTFVEAGMPEFVASPWFAMVAPKGTPPDVVKRMNQAVNKVLQRSTTRERFAKQGASPVVASPEETTKFFREEIAKWATIVEETGAKLE